MSVVIVLLFSPTHTVKDILDHFWQLCLNCFRARRMDVKSADERDVDLVEQAYQYLTVRRMQIAQQRTESKPLETRQRTESSCHSPCIATESEVPGKEKNHAEAECSGLLFLQTALQQKGRSQRFTCLITYLRRVVSSRLRIYSRRSF